MNASARGDAAYPNGSCALLHLGGEKRHHNTPGVGTCPYFTVQFGMKFSVAQKWITRTGQRRARYGSACQS